MTKRTRSVLEGERVEELAQQVSATASALTQRPPDFSLVNPEARQNCLELLDGAMPALHRLQRELRRLARVTATDGAKCRHCGGPMPPSSGARLYCSHSCRQRAYEERRREATA